MRDEYHSKKALRDHAGLEAEILQEIAEALGNAGERVERAIERTQTAGLAVKELRVRLAETVNTGEAQRIAERLREALQSYRSLRQEAIQQYRYFIIHREAVGFRNHKLVQEKYRIPPPMGWPSQDPT
jgi:hypothetical protein